MSKNRSNSYLRYFLQAGTLAVIVLFLTKLIGKDANAESYCPMGGLEALSSYVANGTLACSMTTAQILMGAFLAVAVIFFGKLFCSYICPLGFFEELLVRLRRRLKIKKFIIRRGSIADVLLRLVKYALLFTIFYMTISSSELFCKKLDPYYAVAGGFDSEISLWMACTSLGLLFFGGLLVDMFWCRYICPLGALSNLLKFTLEFVAVVLISYGLSFLGVKVPWVVVLSVLCLMGYLLEVIVRKPKLNLQLLSIRRDASLCTNCGRCEKKCPHHVAISEISGKVNCIDCSLCGECVKVCHENALAIGKRKVGKWLPALIVLLFFFGAHYLGSVTELPTINEKWNDPEIISEQSLKSFDMKDLHSVKCYGSSMAFKAKLERMQGVYGVKTFVKHHRVTIYYDPSVTNPDKIQESVFTPVSFRIGDPPMDAKYIKSIVIRTENMYDKMDPNYLGLQIRNSGRKYYGLETEYACPLIVRLYMDMDEPVDEAFLEEMVSMKTLEMPIHGGGTKVTPVNFKFVRLEEGCDSLELRPYLEKLFKPFKAEFKTRVEQFAGRPQQTMSFSGLQYEKPLTMRNLPFLSNYLSQQDGLIGVYLLLNEQNLPTIRIRYCTDCLSAEKIMNLVNEPKWTIKYKEGDVREENARFNFKDTGLVEKYVEK